MISDKSVCLLCGRVLDKPYDRHHLIPKSRGGTHTVYLHRICHTKIHSVLNEVELKKDYNNIDKLRGHPQIVKFIKWISNKPPSFYKRTKKSNHL